MENAEKLAGGPVDDESVAITMHQTVKRIGAWQDEDMARGTHGGWNKRRWAWTSSPSERDNEEGQARRGRRRKT